MSIHDILNAGIGLYKEGEKGFHQVLQHLLASYDKLRRQGAADQSETAERLRQSLDQTITGIRQISSTAEARLQALLKEAGNNYEQLLSGLEGQIEAIKKQGEKGMDDMKGRMETLAESLKEQGTDRFRRSVERLIAGRQEDFLSTSSVEGERMISVLFSESEEYVHSPKDQETTDAEDTPKQPEP